MDALITARRAGRPQHSPEAELVLVTEHDDTVILTLDDGERLEFDGAELIHALGTVGSLRSGYEAGNPDGHSDSG